MSALTVLTGIDPAFCSQGLRFLESRLVRFILPGMLAVVGADVTCRLLMGRESVFVALLRVFRSEGAERAERLT